MGRSLSAWDVQVDNSWEWFWRGGGRNQKGCRVERQFCFKLGERKTFKDVDGVKLVEGQLRIQEREGLKDGVRSARGWEVVGFTVSLRQEEGPLFL